MGPSGDLFNFNQDFDMSHTNKSIKTLINRQIKSMTYDVWGDLVIRTHDDREFKVYPVKGDYKTGFPRSPTTAIIELTLNSQD